MLVQSARVGAGGAAGRGVTAGRLTATFPRSVGQVPVYYNHFNTGRPGTGDFKDEAGAGFDERGGVGCEQNGGQGAGQRGIRVGFVWG